MLFLKQPRSVVEVPAGNDMTTELWDRLKPLFEAAVEKPPAERQAFLATIDAEEEMRQELQELVKAFEASGSTCESIAAACQKLVPTVVSSMAPGDVLASDSGLCAGLVMAEWATCMRPRIFSSQKR